MSSNDTSLDLKIEEIAIRLLREKADLNYIAKVSGLSIEELLALKNKQ